MDPIAYWLPLVWAALLGVAVVMYVLLDGFDLGIGILFLTGADEQERDTMMNSIAPYWDGNETWLVLGGAGLLVAFPLAYAIIMPALYLPVIVMLLALVFRGVAFEFRFVAKPRHHWWDWSFALGSTVATFCQGIVLGGFCGGFRDGRTVRGRKLRMAATFSDSLRRVVAGYTLLGSSWLMMKTEGDVARSARNHAEVALIVTLCFIAAVSISTPLAFERIADRWFREPARLSLARAFSHSHSRLYYLGRDQERVGHRKLFFRQWCFFSSAFLGLRSRPSPISIPPSVTIWQAAAVPQSQIFSLIGALLFLPLVLAYTAFVYWTFRGKVAGGEGYH